MGRGKRKSYGFYVTLSSPEGAQNNCSDLIDKLMQLEAEFGRTYVVNILRQLTVNAAIGHFISEQASQVISYGNHVARSKTVVHSAPDASLETSPEGQSDIGVQKMDISNVKMGSIGDMIKF